MGLLSQEKEIRQELETSLQYDDIVCICGEEGQGKEYTVCNYINMHYADESLIFKMPRNHCFSDYAAFRETFSHIPVIHNDFAYLLSQGAEYAKDSSNSKISILGFLSKILFDLAQNHAASSLEMFHNYELEILSKMHNLIDKMKIKVFAFINIEDWESSSRLFIFTLIKYKKQIKFLEGVKFIITSTEHSLELLEDTDSRLIFSLRLHLP